MSPDVMLLMYLFFFHQENALKPFYSSYLWLGLTLWNVSEDFYLWQFQSTDTGDRIQKHYINVSS